jgi:hypothetical protein
LAVSDSTAATIGGVAYSNSRADADSRFHAVADSRSSALALSRFGYADADSEATSDGAFGGRATAISDSVSDTWGGVSTSRVRANSGATFHGSAISNGLGVSMSGPGRWSQANVTAIGRANHFGSSRSDGVMVDVRR